MTQAVVSQGFSGSDTDELDKIVAKMRQAAQYAEDIVRALQILCKALDAMSWTGYAKALEMYLEEVVIPLLKAVAAELKAFAAIVAMASSIQKDASSDRWVVDTGDVGYTPQQLPSGPSATDAPAGEQVSVAAEPTIGSVDTALTPRHQAVSTTASTATGSVDQVGRDARLQRVSQDISSLMAHIQQLQGATAAAGHTSQAIAALGSIVTDIGHLVGDVDGSGATPSGTAGDVPSVGGDIAGTSGPVGPGTGTGIADPSASGIDLGSDAALSQIWSSVNGVLQGLGISPADTVTAPDPSGAGLPGGTGTVDGSDPAPGAAGSDPTAPISVDRAAVSGDIGAISGDLDKLRADLGLDSPSVGSDVQYGVGDGSLGAGLAGSSPTGADLSAVAPSMPDSYSPDPASGLGGGSCPGGSGDLGGGSGSGGSGDLGGGSGSGGSGDLGGGSGDLGGGSGSGGSGDLGGGSGALPAPAGGPAAPTYAADAAIPVTASGTVPATIVTDGPQTRLVATTMPTGSSSAAIPLSGGAVAASLLGGVFARKARHAAGADLADATGDPGDGAPLYQP